MGPGTGYYHYRLCYALILKQEIEKAFDEYYKAQELDPTIKDTSVENVFKRKKML